jgi:hypothetical protein
VALRLAATGEIHPQGSLAHLVAPPQRPAVDDGDRRTRGYRRHERPLIPDLTGVTRPPSDESKPLDLWEGVNNEVKAFFDEAQCFSGS